MLERWPSPACRQAGAEGKNLLMYYVYILKSSKDNNLYIGKTNNISRRLLEHNSGQTQSLRNRLPMTLLEVTECKDEKEARILEKEYKKGYKREEIRKKYKLK